MKTSLLLIFAFSAVLLFTALSSARSEVDLALSGGGAARDFFDRVSSVPLPKPQSISGTELVLRRCTEVVGGLYGALQPVQISQMARMHCQEFAHAVLATMPTHPFAHFLVAQMRFLTGDLQSGSIALAASQSFGVHEQWLVELRVDLAETYFDSLSPQALNGHLADLNLLAQSARGVRAIAYRYVSDPQFRERITAVVETLPAEQQTRFIGNVRRAAETFGFARATS